MTQTKDFSAAFKENKYFVLKSFVTDPLLTVLYQYALMKAKTGKMKKNDLFFPGTPVFFRDLRLLRT